MPAIAPPSLLLQFDVPEPRTVQDRLVVSADGTSWTARCTDNTFIDPVTQTLMLLPVPYRPEWTTTATGDYVRLTKADYTLPTPAKWFENHRAQQGDIYLESLGVNEVVTTIATFPRNRAFYISTFVFGLETNRAIILECGWGSPGTGVSLRFSADGNVEVWKNGVRVGVYDLGGQAELGGVKQKQGAAASIAGRTVDFQLIPCRARELLVLTSAGAGFSHTFTDLDATPGAGTQTITEANSKFWWRVPSGKASVQCAPLRFATSGIACGQRTQLLYPPPTGATFTPIVAKHDAGYGSSSTSFALRDPDGAGQFPTFDQFIPNGVRNQALVVAALAGDGISTPFVYGVDMVRDRQAGSTANAPFDLTPYATSLRLDVPADGPATLSFGAFDVDTLLRAGLAQAGRTGDRPVRLAVVSNQPAATVCDIFRGTAGKPDIVRGGGTGALSGAVSTLAWEATDRSKQFELYRFRSTLPYDGYNLSEAFRDLAKLPGFADAELDISADTFTLPFSPGVSKGDWKLLPERGDSVSDWLDKLYKDYAATWVIGWSPVAVGAGGYKWQARRPDTLPAVPVLTVYQNAGTASAAGVAPALVSSRLIHGLREKPDEAEANQVIVIGYDPGTQTYIYSQFDDAASQTPGTAPAARPGNWRGQIASYQLLDPNITTVAAANRARDLVSARVATERGIVEFDSDLLMKANGAIPVWRGDKLRIMNGDGSLYGVVRVLALSIEAQNEGSFKVRQCTYVCLYLPGEV